MYQGEASVHDRKNTAETGARDNADVAAAFDRYAQGVFTYCLSRLSVPAGAADAVQDTFIIASYKASGLAEPGRLRAWLFAVARNECHKRLQTATPSAPLYEAAEAMDNTEQLSAITKQAELRALVRAALAELDPVEREICELNLRHGLTGADLAAVLGVPRSQAQALASRACARFERSLGVPLMASAGPEYCSDLAAILDGSGRKPAVLLRRRVKQHIERCRVCSELKRRDLAPAMLLSMLTVPVLPAGLRSRILDLVSSTDPEAAAYRAEIMDRAGPFGADGFPVQLTTPTVSRRKSAALLAAALAAAAVALLGGGTYYVEYTSTHSGPTPSTSASASARPSSRPAKTPDRTPSATAPAVVPASVSSRAPTAAATTPLTSASATHSPTPTRSPTASASATPTHSASATPTPSSPSATPTPSSSSLTATPTPSLSP